MKAIDRARRVLAASLVIGALSFSLPVSATVLLSEDFTGATMYYGQEINLLDNPGNTGNDNLDKWIDSANTRWAVQSGGICAPPCSGAFAQHLVQTDDNTNLLYYGLSGASLAAGDTLNLSLDYIASNRAGTAYLVGMMNGQHSLDPFAPWFESGGNDGVVLGSVSLGPNASWSTATLSATLGQAFDVIVVAFEMGGTTGARGIDNVSLTVPEPGMLALLGLGLVGLGFARRRKA